MTERDDNQDDKDLKDYLAGDSEVSRRYRKADGDAPSSALDRRILLAARESIAADEAPTQRTRLLSWERPWAIAAVVALSATLVVSIQRETGFFAPGSSETPSEQEVANRQSATGNVLVEEALPGDASASPTPSNTVPETDEVVVTATRSRRVPEAKATADDDGSNSQNLVVPASPEPEAARRDREAISVERRQSDSAAELSESQSDVAGFAAAKTVDDATQALEAIASLWRAGDEAEALRQLEEFRDDNPDFDEARLRDALPESLLELAGIGPR